MPEDMGQDAIRQAETWLNIDIGIRGLIGKLLDHGYQTKFSCNGQ